MTDKLGAANQPRCHGPLITAQGVVFNLWAPSALSIELLEVGQPPRKMPKDTDGWYQLFSPTARVGSRYQFRINGALVVPDPASRFQPDDVGEPSEVVDITALRDHILYTGRPWAEAVIYELHVGTFSPEGTYAGVERKLDYLRDLGITAIELMPLNDVPGRYNWGYDGVLLNAPNARYGRPEDLKRFLHAAHERDMMVYLDVVYNHFGPQLNYLHSYAENFFTKRHSTGWGPAVNLEGNDGVFVRQFLIDNALMWLRDYGFDGLRLDAVHALKDDSAKHFLVELAETVRSRLVGRHVHLMLENEANQAHLLERPRGCTRLYNAQWGDDFHNALHVLLTGEDEGYYKAFADKPLQHLARALTEGFAYQGEIFPLHDEPRGEPSAHLPPDATIFFAQNHDQIGNRALGERFTQLVGKEKLRQAMVLLTLNPHIPLLFMGEEAAAATPFLFFADWTGEAANLTREGRRKEFAHFQAFSTPQMRNQIPDPCQVQTFEASRLDWNNIMHAPISAEFRALTKELLAIRREKVVPLLKAGFKAARAELLGAKRNPGGLNVIWRSANNDLLQIVTNFSGQPLPRPPLIEGEYLWGSDPARGHLYLHPTEIIVRRGFDAAAG
ncbi:MULTISPECIES: malto-oligosyltrehalose trehalohydrolase [Bradyrhizobium]|uniref:malto-oligosyltrehalose trehalohydrolase n=1 Tax=Bradyrhizobium TaxID=374 RepID=UPI0003FEFD0C|nr:MULTISPECIES: malto-oligosyltrehalose trehalohydrolase [Bradyrhizobium]UFW49041.1 malto-oligosyltrehalose trehalohydrolase [Bradyrhizobium arachidis]